MKKIGILTYWGVANYGACVQAYALNKVLHEICEEDTIIEHIAYLDKSHWEMYYKTDTRLNNAFCYSWDEIPHTENLDVDDLEKKEFDIICIGSDAVWEINPNYNDDMHLFGQKLKANRIISYAASFGNVMANQIPDVAKNVDFDVFNCISVRDKNSQSIIRELTGKEASIVLDPALLWDFKDDKNIKKTQFKNYILVYGVEWTDEFIYGARKYAREHGLKLISAGYTNNWCDMSLRLVELRVWEWIGLFAGAQKVYTSTFHGLMLGLNYERDIAFCQVGYVKNRSQTLIEKLDIEREVMSFNESINYSAVTTKLLELRKISMEHLRRGISE